MKKGIYFFMTLLLLSFFSCSSSDDSDNQNYSILGKWIRVKTVIFNQNFQPIDSTNYSINPCETYVQIGDTLTQHLFYSPPYGQEINCDINFEEWKYDWIVENDSLLQNLISSTVNTTDSIRNYKIEILNNEELILYNKRILGQQTNYIRSYYIKE